MSGGILRQMSLMETIIDMPTEHEKNVFGYVDKHVKLIEKTLNVTVVARDGKIKVIGNSENVEKAKSVFLNLMELSKRGNNITQQNVDYAITMSMEENDLIENLTGKKLSVEDFFKSINQT